MNRIEEYIELYKMGGYIREMRKHVGHAPIQTCACGVIVENDKGEILLQRRQDNGCWGIIGGAMEMGESFEEAVRRETMEESGLSLGKLEIFQILSGKDHIIEYPNGDICFGPGIVFHTREFWGEIVNDPEEVMEHHFFARTELPENLSGYGRGIILEWAERKKQAEDRSRVRGVHHISLKCGTKEEFEKAKNFYIDLLGFREVRSWPEGIMIDFGNGMLEIFSNGPGIKTKGALRHIAFATDDVDGVTEKVKSAGYEVFIEPKDIVIPSDPAYPARMAFCYGPLREEIEFFQER